MKKAAALKKSSWKSSLTSRLTACVTFGRARGTMPLQLQPCPKKIQGPCFLGLRLRQVKRMLETLWMTILSKVQPAGSHISGTSIFSFASCISSYLANKCMLRWVPVGHQHSDSMQGAWDDECQLHALADLCPRRVPDQHYEATLEKASDHNSDSPQLRHRVQRVPSKGCCSGHFSWMPSRLKAAGWYSAHAGPA